MPNYNPSGDSTKDLKERSRRTITRMRSIADIAHTRKLTPAESDEFEQLKRQDDELNSAIRVRNVQKARAKKANNGIEGKPNEVITRDQSMSEWVRRAAENGVQWSPAGKNGGAPRPVVHWDNAQQNAYWGQRMGFARPGAELRALGEDTTGSGVAITPQSWTASYIDYLYANVVAGKLGVSRVAMPTEIVNVPQLVSPAAPAWQAENSTIGIDASPAFSTVALNAGGGWKDITLYSRELAQDAYIQGGLPGMLAQSMAKKFALALDIALIYGISSSSAIAPGIINESGFNTRYYTGASAGVYATPADTTEFSKVTELIRAANDEPTGGILCNPQVAGTMARLNASTYAKYWDFPNDVMAAGVDNFIYTTQLTNTETAANPPVTTGGTGSSFFMGPWQRVMMGVHLGFETMVLNERYVDMNQVGLFGFLRASIRTGHPEAFYRTTSITTS
jgi:HK97 family phage major capsid protein